MWILLTLTILICAFVKHGKLLDENLESLLYVHESKQSNSHKEKDIEDEVSDDDVSSATTNETKETNTKNNTKERKSHRGLSRKRVTPDDLNNIDTQEGDLLEKLSSDASIDDIAETGLDYIRGRNA